MRKIRLQLETVTPMFLGGAEPRGTPELRAPSFRGVMRYWFRALAGGVVGDSDQAMDEIRLKEAEIFGKAEHGQSPQRSRHSRQGREAEVFGQSAVWVRLSIPTWKGDYKTRLLPHRGEEFKNYEGKRLKNPPRSAIPPGVSFKVILTLKPNADTWKLDLALWSLLVGLTLGGIGKRSRRGFGSLRVASADNLLKELDEALQKQLKRAAQLPANGDELAKQICEMLVAAQRAFEKHLDKPASGIRINNPPRFSLLSLDTPIVIWIPDSVTKSPEEVLGALMDNLSDQMQAVGVDKFAQAFGGIHPRRASPLWVSTHRLQNQRLALVLTYLNARYLRKQPGNQRHLAAEFLNSPPDGWTKVEVRR